MPCGYIDTEDQRWLIDKAGYLLERVDKTQEVQAANILSGEELLAPKPGGQINWKEAEKRNALVAVLQALSEHQMIGKVQQVDVSALYSIRFTYENRLSVLLGSTENLGKKFTMLDVVLPQLAPTDRGELNVSNAKEARFAPEKKQTDAAAAA